MFRPSTIHACFVRLKEDRGGNFGIMTALLAVPLMLSAGMAIDYSAATTKRVDLQGLADSAALAGGGTFDGTNEAAAKAAARAYLKTYAQELPTGTEFDVKMSGQTLEVSLSSSSDNAFMDLAGYDTTPISVTAAAISPMKPKKITFTPTKAQGWYYKKVSIIVLRPNGKSGTYREDVVGTVTYQPQTQADGGQGTMEVLPSSTLELGEYAKLVLQMDIKNDGCGLKEHATVTNSVVTCNKSEAKADKDYNLTLRTDNPDTSHYLFVDGKQLPKGVASPLDAILECEKTSNHAWEDGGGFARQDFFYTAKSICAPNGQFVRLTK
jgi:Flp pilus assembly protein TadG